MAKRNLLVVPECEQMLNEYREEIAMEFGIHRNIQEMDAVSKLMTEKLLKETKEDRKAEDCK